MPRQRVLAKLLTKSLRCFLPRGDNRLTKRNLHQQCLDIRGFLNLQELVCGIALQTTNSRGGVVECHAFLSQESFQTHLVETLSVRSQEVVFVLKENPTDNMRQLLFVEALLVRRQVLVLTKNHL